jgi:hypothetical protein
MRGAALERQRELIDRAMGLGARLFAEDPESLGERLGAFWIV